MAAVAHCVATDFKALVCSPRRVLENDAGFLERISNANTKLGGPRDNAAFLIVRTVKDSSRSFSLGPD